jgi:hypothetical protein
MVVTSILGIIVAILGAVLTTTLTTFNRQSDRSAILDQTEILVSQIQHDVYGARVLNVIASPNNELQLIAVLPSTGHTDTASCIEYRVSTASGTSPVAIQRQAWTLGTLPPSTSTWPVMLSSLKLTGSASTAGYVIPNPAGISPFTSAGSNGQSVNISLQVQNGSAPPVIITTTATGVEANATGSSAAAAAWAAQC